MIIDGQVPTVGELKRIHSVEKLYSHCTKSLVIISPVALQKLARAIELDINNPEIQVRAVNGWIVLEGEASPVERDLAEIKAKIYLQDRFVEEAEADKKVIPFK